MAKPLLLDLFCGAGGAAVGYQRAGFELLGVDVRPQPRYPFAFVQADALELLAGLLDDRRLLLGSLLDDVAAIHASPPCQRYSSLTRVKGDQQAHPDMVAPVRELLLTTGLPYVIENVVGAPLRAPTVLCGAALCPTIDDGGRRYRIRRHRLFETNWLLLAPGCACRSSSATVLGVYGGGTRQDTRRRHNTAGGNTQKANAAQATALLEVAHMTREELTQAVPAAYTQLIGHQLAALVAAQPV